MNNVLKNVLLWVAIGVILMLVFQNLNTSSSTPAQAMDFSTFVNSIKQGQVADVNIDANHVTGSLSSGQKFSVYTPTNDTQLVPQLLAAGVKINVKPPAGQSILLSILISWFPMLLLIGVWIFFMRQMGGGGAGGRGAMTFGRSKARMLTEENNKVTFADVAGVEEAKEELAEIVDFLRDPQKFQRLGGRIPKGVLLMGSPGAGKTLLARAIAGEARVPFFSISGSDFVEMFVGVGASRVRDMFEQAKKHAPCIIFIDEIDAVGRQRGAGLGGGNDEREQTLNQLLVEMDGFEGTEGIIVVAATNRPDVLDPALLRPGRFDRQVTVPLPDIRGREQILQVHMRKVPITPDVDPKVIARGTPGFSGADLANLVNEAALMAARKSKRLVDMHDFENAKDKVMMGAERKSVVMSDKQRETTAYHESGHAVVAKLLPGTDPVHKVTIIPRGRALGVTMQLPWGMSSIGPMVIGEKEEEVFIGREMTKHSNISEQTAMTVDGEIRNIIRERYDIARKLIEENRDKVEAMAQALLKYETLDSNQVSDIMAGRDPRPPVDGAGSYPSMPSDGNAASPDKTGGQPLPGLNPGEHPV